VKPEAADEIAGAESVTASPDGGGRDVTEHFPDNASCVLVIDDDPVQRDLMQRFLSKEGFYVQTAAGGDAGLRLARQLRPVAITLDVMMPDMDGWTVLSALKSDAALRDIPVIMVTMLDDPERGFALGAADYATKPVDRQRLSQILKKYTCPHPPCPVLMVEDDPATRALTRKILEKEGWTVREAENGKAGLQAVAESKPSVILLDLMMPVMNGFDFIREMRKNKDWQDIPVVILTAKDLTVEDRQQLKGNVERVLQKGDYNREQLLSEVRELVKHRVQPESPAKS